ncbi:hypothetical protein PAMC26577_03445 [Caballeronia sordidicola]|uniref:Uncharacterized protein n=1 Tax=Caballeronia sordidicola TaxID=196367 RepID=A0A242N5F6_CABSO|nr:hypothetical protein PAMC26577_03445 [Caballeronia sordidicola]
MSDMRIDRELADAKRHPILPVHQKACRRIVLGVAANFLCVKK